MSSTAAAAAAVKLLDELTWWGEALRVARRSRDLAEVTWRE